MPVETTTSPRKAPQVYLSGERILTIGRAGVGKTYGWLTVAQWLKNHTFHVLDPDDGVCKVWDNEFPDVNNIMYYFTPHWFGELGQVDTNRWVGGLRDAFAKVKVEVKPNDWVVVEHMGMFWDMVQSAFTDEVFDKDIGLYFLERRKALEVAKAKGKKEPPGLQAFDGWKDWTVINKLHNADFVSQFCYELPVNVYMTSSFSEQSRELATKEEADIKAFYEGTSIRVDGQKHIPFKAQSILLLTGNPDAGFRMTTFQKDRGRRWVKGVPVKNFAKQYLIGVAGWSPDGSPRVKRTGEG